MVSPSPVVGEADWPNYESLRSLVETFDTIIVGRVGAPSLALQPLDPQEIESGQRQVAWVDYFSLYPVEVIRVIASPRARRGGTLTVAQQGGVIDGVTYMNGGDPPLMVGAVYLLFLRDSYPGFGLDQYGEFPGGRFLTDERGFLVPNRWEASPGVAAVSGVSYKEVQEAIYSENPDQALVALAKKSVDEAAIDILAAIALAPLPALSTRFPLPTTPTTDG